MSGFTDWVEVAFGDNADSCFNAVSGGAAENVVISGSMTNTSLAYAAAFLQPGGTSWTQSEINGLVGRVGYSSDTTPNPDWNALMLEVDVDL